MTSTIVFFFFFNDTATTEIYTLSLHDALPIFAGAVVGVLGQDDTLALSGTQIGLLATVYLLGEVVGALFFGHLSDRKNTRLNSSHANISYAVFCLKKKNI